MLENIYNRRVDIKIIYVAYFLSISEMITLKQKTITGIGWSTVGNVGKQGLQFVISVVLARLLTLKILDW